VTKIDRHRSKVVWSVAGAVLVFSGVVCNRCIKKRKEE
jgi:hypothetical protein